MLHFLPQIIRSEAIQNLTSSVFIHMYFTWSIFFATYTVFYHLLIKGVLIHIPLNDLLAFCFLVNLNFLLLHVNQYTFRKSIIILSFFFLLSISFLHFKK